MFVVSASSSAHSSPSAIRGKRRQRKACSSTPSTRVKKIKLAESAACTDDDDIVMVAEGLYSLVLLYPLYGFAPEILSVPNFKPHQWNLNLLEWLMNKMKKAID